MVILGVIFIAHNQATEVVQPCEKPFDFPTAFGAAQSAAVLSGGIRPTALTVWSDHLRTELSEHLFIKRVAVISLISNHSLRTSAIKRCSNV